MPNHDGQQRLLDRLSNGSSPSAHTNSLQRTPYTACSPHRCFFWSPKLLVLYLRSQGAQGRPTCPSLLTVLNIRNCSVLGLAPQALQCQSAFNARGGRDGVTAALGAVCQEGGPSFDALGCCQTVRLDMC